jgi:hypothetical protein
MIESPVLTKWFRQRDVETLQGVVLKKLESHFGGPVPPDVSATVRVLGDEGRLEALLDAVYASATLDEFCRTLAAPQAPAPTDPAT